MTPMLRQYMSIKDNFPDAILFFRMGDFYEMFFDDAVKASKILGITLTSRGKHEGEKIPMCGIPYHAYKTYIGKLVDRGVKVAICEQTEDPKVSKGIVKREVVRVVTPGVVVDEQEVDQKDNIFMASVSEGKEIYGLAHLDLSTGEFRVTEIRYFEHLLDEIARIRPAELLVPENGRLAGMEALSGYRVEILHDDSFDPRRSERLLKEQLNVSSLAGFGCQDMIQGINAAGALVHYLRDTQKGLPDHIREIVSYHLTDFMVLDDSTCTHLELLKSMSRQTVKGTLFDVLDKPVTPMGSRLLKNWISYPLVNVVKIRERLAAVACFKNDPLFRSDMRDSLKGIYDIGRLNGRIALKRANARDLLALKSSLAILPSIKTSLEQSTSTLLADISSRIDNLQDVVALIEESIHDEPPLSMKDGGIIKKGYNGDLDDLVSMSRDGKSWIAKFAVDERERTGISNLKVGFNRVFGYYIEISKSNIALAPPDYVRKQTLVNGERFITEALKIKEGQVLGAEERRIELEAHLFEGIRENIARENQRIKETAELVSIIDVLAGLAETAEDHNYTCPEVNESLELDIVDGRHPVVELSVKDEDFVPNDIYLDAGDQQIIIITGPNMAGKSTILRQTALTVLMAQMGSFVPASKAVIGIVDRIFTRVGASDDLARGRSTFMVEMNETANILRHSGTRSLVVLDEIGRGTSTYDGLSIAWAVAESLHDLKGAGVRTLFATHYHELTELATTMTRVKNFNVAVREWNDKIVFLRKMVPGSASRSYGIQVARLAGIPDGVIDRAKEILDNLESGEKDEIGRPRLASEGRGQKKGGMVQLDLFGSLEPHLREWICGISVNSMTPIEALVELSKLKEYVDSGGERGR